MKIPREHFFVLVTFDMLQENFELLRSRRLNCSVYVSAHGLLDGYKKDDLLAVGDLFAKNDLKLIVHGPFVDLNPGSIDSKIRRTTLERYREALRVASLLGSPYLTLHSGFRNKPYARKYHEEWIAHSIDSWKQFTAMAEAEGVTVHIENAFEPDPAPLVRVVSEVNTPRFKVCFDAGHYHAFSKTAPLPALAMIPPELIGEIHLSDNDGSDDQHLPLGEGTIDIPLLLKNIESLGIEPLFTAEPRDIASAEHDLAYLRKRGLLD